MKKTLILLTVLVVGISAFGLVGDVNAQAPTPVYPGNGGNGRGGSAGTGTGIPMEQNISLDGLLDDLMASMIVDGLGITVEDLKAREAVGESLVEIGLSLGFDVDTILDLHEQARIDALNQALVDGLITQDQADWMISRLDNGQFGDSTGVCLEDCTQTLVQNAQKSQQGRGRNRPSSNP